MRAIVLDHFGGLDSLVIKEIPEPEPEPGKVVIQIKAFGINHAEMHMRRGDWAEAAPVSGIECVGIVKSCPGGEFAVGSKVAALMGGLGRTINGSYAEYTRANVGGVVQIESSQPWEELAALPESYATAWTCLFRSLELMKGQTLLIRGATSSLGLAALNMAVEAGAKVIATTRNRDRFKKLEELGVYRAELEGPELSTRIAESKQIDAILDLVGNSVILDSLRILRRGGPSLSGRMARRPGFHRGFQSFAADGQRTLSDLFCFLRIWNPRLSSFRCSTPGDREKSGARQVPGKTVASLSL
jgi:NADPH:quinone reductase